MRMRIDRLKNGDIHYYGMGAKRNDKNPQKVETYREVDYGKYSELITQHPDPEQYVKDEIEKYNNDSKKDTNRISINNTISFSQRLDSIGKASEKTEKNIGWLYVKEIYDQLQIPEFFKLIKGKERYSTNDVNLLLTVGRFLDPLSKYATYTKQGNYLFMPKVNKDNIYDTLTKISDNLDLYQNHLLKNTIKVANPDTDVLYYDCTNFYTEASVQDEEIIDDDNGDILQYGFRRYGANKEHRPNPCVGFGLFVDKNGFPLSFSVYKGSDSEQISAVPEESKLLKNFRNKGKGIIYCADGGLNSTSIRAFNSIAEKDYIVSESLKKMKDEEIQKIFSDDGWYFIDDDKPVSYKLFRDLTIKLAKGEVLTEAEKATLNKDMIYKKYSHKRETEFRDNKSSDKIVINTKLKENLYITFSVKFFLYESKVFSKQLLRAEDWVNKKVDVSKFHGNDFKRFIKSEHITNNAEVADKLVVSIDQNLEKKERRLIGVYACATSLDRPIKEILNQNKYRWQVERDFQIMKSYFDSRPFWVRKDESIEGHFATCYTALLIYKIMEMKLNANLVPEQHLTIDDIFQTLRNMCIDKEGDLYYRANYTGSTTLDRLEECYGLGLDHKYYKSKVLSKRFECTTKK